MSRYSIPSLDDDLKINDDFLLRSPRISKQLKDDIIEDRIEELDEVIENEPVEDELLDELVEEEDVDDEDHTATTIEEEEVFEQIEEEKQEKKQESVQQLNKDPYEGFWSNYKGRSKESFKTHDSEFYGSYQTNESDDDMNFDDVDEPIEVQNNNDIIEIYIRLAAKIVKENIGGLGSNYFNNSSRVCYTHLKMNYKNGVHGHCPQGVRAIVAAMLGDQSIAGIKGNADQFSYGPSTGGGLINYPPKYYTKYKIDITNYMEKVKSLQVGDIIANAYNIANKNWGHIQVWTGVNWYSDFKQGRIQLNRMDKNSVALWRLNDNGMKRLKQQRQKIIRGDYNNLIVPRRKVQGFDGLK